MQIIFKYCSRSFLSEKFNFFRFFLVFKIFYCLDLYIFSLKSESIRINSSRIDRNQVFESELIRINPRSEWFGLILMKIRFWLIFLDESKLRLIRVENLVWISRIHLDYCLGLNGLIFDRFTSNEAQNAFRIGSE